MLKAAWLLVLVCLVGCDRSPNLVRCPDCGAAMSRNAVSCPNCGYTPTERLKEQSEAAALLVIEKRQEAAKAAQDEWDADVAIGGVDFAAKERQRRMDERNRARVQGK